MPSFEEAKKEYHYAVGSKKYRKVTYEESGQYADAKQFTYNGGKSLGWFVPLDAKPTPPPSKGAA